MTNLSSQILTELSYTDLTTAQLARRLGEGARKLMVILKELEKEGKIKRGKREEEDVWELINHE